MSKKINEEKLAPSVAIGVLILNRKGEIFLGKSPKWSNLWIVPGGHVEYGETLEDCLEREIKEELGAKIENVSFLQIQEEIKPPAFCDPQKHFIFINYTAQLLDPEATIVLERNEFEEFCFIDPQKALSDLDLNRSTRKLIEEFLRR